MIPSPSKLIPNDKKVIPNPPELIPKDKKVILSLSEMILNDKKVIPNLPELILKEKKISLDKVAPLEGCCYQPGKLSVAISLHSSFYFSLRQPVSTEDNFFFKISTTNFHGFGHVLIMLSKAETVACREPSFSAIVLTADQKPSTCMISVS